MLGRAKICLAAIFTMGQPLTVTSSRCTIDEEDRLIGIFDSVRFDRKRLLRRYIANPLICWKKRSFLDVGGFDESIRYAEDYDLALRMAEKFQFQNIEAVLYKPRRRILRTLKGWGTITAVTS